MTSSSRIVWLCAAVVAVAALVYVPPAAAAPCDPPVANEIVCENSKPGSPSSEWDVNGAGDPALQGYATDISVDQGATVDFKVKSSTSAYRIDIYRMGYYGGMGARKVDTVRPLLSPLQPSCLSESTTGLIDCGNWSVAASWAVPSDAVSGIYLAKLVREDGVAGASHMVFIVRDDDGHSDLLFQTADATWQAYNRYGGNSFYKGGPAGRSYKVSYNRPFINRDYKQEDWLFNAEYPMVRWLERNGYDVSYFTNVDSARSGAEIREHKAFLSVGHDEYWSSEMRANVEAARAAGVHLAFFSGNEVFWKTRWESSSDSSATPYRTLVSYKETHSNQKIDPEPGVWTGTWRDPRFSPPADGGRPENSLTGQLFMVNAGANTTSAIKVPAAEGKMRFWRNTSVASLAPGTTATMPTGTLGFEWDEDKDNPSRPPGSLQMSSTTVSGVPYLQDYGSTYASGTATHHLSLYRHSSGSLVFGAGTVQWSWGLDDDHDRGNLPADARMQQATTNLFADMGAQPATLQSNLVQATASTDTAGPSVEIASPPSEGATAEAGVPLVISGSAADAGGGNVGGVEVSVDGGTTWRRASGRESWSYSWTPRAAGSASIKARAVDDSGNLGSGSPAIPVTIKPRSCPCSIWSSSATPATKANTTDTAPIEVGVKFRPTVDGFITGLRFYKGATNTGTHTGHLWSSSGARLAEAVFTGESAEGWQQVLLAAPVAVSAGTTYVASYHTTVGNYALTRPFFATSGVDSDPLYALGNTEGGGNGVYAYGSSGTFPNKTYQSTNYWVDVVFHTQGVDEAPPGVDSVTPRNNVTGIAADRDVTATFNEPMDAASVTTASFELRDPSGNAVPAAVTYDALTKTARLDPTGLLNPKTRYTARVGGGSGGVKDRGGNPMTNDFSWSFTTGSATQYSIWSESVTPANKAKTTDTSPVEVGVKFRASVDGFITGLRFYKGSTNTGTHTGHLWSSSGTRLAEAVFTDETAEGWQQVMLTNPVPVSSGVTYVASYHTRVGNYAFNPSYFATSGFDSDPLRALGNTEAGGNGVYAYGPSGTFPSSTHQSTNYWVDVVFDTEGVDTDPPRVASASPANDATGVSAEADVKATFDQTVNAATVNGTTFQLRSSSGDTVPATVRYDAQTKTATLDPTSSLGPLTRYTATVAGGPGGVTDPSGNAMASDFRWSFTTRAATGYTLWANAVTPTNKANTADSAPIEVGVKFRTSVNGSVVGLRFYKGTTNTGTHTGHLWTSTGTRLAEAVFTGETADGWQQVALSSPVPLTPGTTYVASYHTTVGNYAFNRPYFATSGFDNPPLRALSNAESGGNGVYAYGPSGTFPNKTYQSTNYWVDLVFDSAGTP